MKLELSAFVADPQLIQALETRAIPVACAADQVLFRQGDAPEGIFILNRGEATLTMISASGETVMSGQVPAGALLGLPGLISNQPYTLTAIAHKDADLSFVPRESFTALMQADPMVSLKILEVLAAEVRSARTALVRS